MKLEDFLKDKPSDKRIRIGTKPGGKYVYIGTKKDFNPQKVWNDCKKFYIDSLLRQMLENRRSYKSIETPLINIIKKFCGMVWFPDREVIEYYPGDYEPDMLVIIVPGDESLVDYEPDIPPLDVDAIPDESVNGLIDAIYQGAARELVAKRIEDAKSTNIEKARNARREARQLERWFREDPYDILDDPNGIVKACRQQSKEIVEGRKTLKRKDRKVWDY